MAYEIKFTIIITVFNKERSIKTCMDSLVNQTFKNIEIIVVDDGSSDNSIKEIEKYVEKDKRIKLIKQENQGVSKARNVGLTLAQGEYISFIDSDDIIDLDTFEKLKNFNEDIVVFGGDSFPPEKWVDNALRTRDITYEKESVKALMEEKGSRPFSINKIYRKELLNSVKIPFPLKMDIGEDQAWMFAVFPKAKRIRFLSNRFYHYRQNVNGSAMVEFRKHPEERLFKHFKIVYYAFNIWRRYGIFEQNLGYFIDWIKKFLWVDILSSPFHEKFIYLKKLNNFINKINNLLVKDDYRGNKSKLVELKFDISEKLKVFDSYRPFYCSDNPYVSIVVPIFNSEKFLKECLDSILQQSFKNFELICVDDGSVDNSRKILHSYCKMDRRIKIILGSHKYAGNARNKGIDISKGKYILFLDSDDFFDNTLIEKAVKQSDIFSSDICVFASDIYDNSKKTFLNSKYTCNSEIITKNKLFSLKTEPQYIFRFTTPAPWNKLYLTKFIKSNNLRFQGTRTANDMRFVLTSLSIAKSIVILDEVLLHYRRNGTLSLQETQHLEPMSFFCALESLYAELKQRNVFDKIEPALKNFALDCCFYNLHTLRTYESFSLVYTFLKREGLKKLGLITESDDYFYAYKTNQIIQKRKDLLTFSINEYIQKYRLKVSKRTMVSIIVLPSEFQGASNVGLNLFDCPSLLDLEIISPNYDIYKKPIALVSSYIPTKFISFNPSSPQDYLNNAIKCSQSEYVYFYDIHSFISENTLKEMYEKAKTLKSTVCACSYSYTYTPNNPSFPLKKIFSLNRSSMIFPNMSFSKILHFDFLLTSCLFSKQFILHNDFLFNSSIPFSLSKLKFFFDLTYNSKDFAFIDKELILFSSFNETKQLDDLLYNLNNYKLFSTSNIKIFFHLDSKRLSQVFATFILKYVVQLLNSSITSTQDINDNAFKKFISSFLFDSKDLFTFKSFILLLIYTLNKEDDYLRQQISTLSLENKSTSCDNNIIVTKPHKPDFSSSPNPQLPYQSTPFILLIMKTFNYYKTNGIRKTLIKIKQKIQQQIMK